MDGNAAGSYNASFDSRSSVPRVAAANATGCDRAPGRMPPGRVNRAPIISRPAPIDMTRSPPDPDPKPTVALAASLFRRMARLWPFFGRPASVWAIAAGATLLLALSEPLIPALLQPLLDRGFQKAALPLWVVPVSLVLLFGVRGLCSFAAQLAMTKITSQGLVVLRKAMFARLLDAQLSLFSAQTSSALANTIVYEVQSGATLLVSALMTLTRNSLTLLALVAYLLYLNWKLTLIVVCLFPAVAYVMRKLSRRLYRVTRNSQEATDRLAYVVEENVLAHRDVRLHAAQDSQARRFHSLSDGLRRLSMKSTAASAAMTPLTQLLAAIALSTVITVALVQSADHNTSVGGFVAFVTAMLMLIAPLKHLTEVANPITRGLAAMERGLDLIATTPGETGGTFAKQRASGAIRFDHVGVTYGDNTIAALDNFSLEVAAGETIALVGASGAGKTTLVNLLPRFTEVGSGGVYLDDHDLRTWDLGSLRRQFAVVSRGQPACADAQRHDRGQRGARAGTRPRKGRALPCRGQPAKPGRRTAARARYRGGTQRHAALGRATPAPGHRARVVQGRAGADPRRSYVGAGRGIGARGPGGAATADAKAHHAGHRAPPVDRATRRPHRGNGKRPYPGDRGARRAAAGRWPLRAPVRPGFQYARTVSHRKRGPVVM